MLTDQKDSIVHALPAGLAGALGSTGLLDGVADRLGQGVSTVAQAGRAAGAQASRTANVAATSAAGVAGSAARGSQRSAGGIPRWVIGVAAVLALIWAAYTFLWNGDQSRQVADQPAGTATQTGDAAGDLLVGDVNLGEQVTDVIEGTTTTLNGVTDAASAEAALPKLNELNDSLGKLEGMVGQLPAEGKSALAALVSGSLSDLEALIAKVSEMPGVGEVIKTVANSMLEKLRTMTA